MTAVVGAASKAAKAAKATPTRSAGGFGRVKAPGPGEPSERIDLRTPEGRRKLDELQKPPTPTSSPRPTTPAPPRRSRASSSGGVLEKAGDRLKRQTTGRASRVVADSAGMLLGLVVYGIASAFIAEGPEGVRAWLGAKFINEGADVVPSATTAGLGGVQLVGTAGPTPALGQLRFPVPGGTYSNSFGQPRSGGRRHQGIDIFAPEGTPIVAATSGTVGDDFSNTLGGVVVKILGDDSVHWYYAHLREGSVRVRAGQRVVAGTLLGEVGDTGNARGTPHLHFSANEGLSSNFNVFDLLQRGVR